MAKKAMATIETTMLANTFVIVLELPSFPSKYKNNLRIMPTIVAINASKTEPPYKNEKPPQPIPVASINTGRL